jgi:hypothetical protein
MKELRYRAYIDQKDNWTKHKQVIMAQYNDELIVLYAAAPRKRVRGAALTELQPGGMLWLSVEFTGVAQRSGWGTHPERGGVLAVWVARPAFDTLLTEAVPTRYQPGSFPDEAAWQAAAEQSGVRAQWDAIRTPDGGKHPTRRTLFLGLPPARLEALTRAVQHTLDLSAYISEQGRFRDMPELLLVPAEKRYPAPDEQTAARLGLDKWAG